MRGREGGRGGGMGSEMVVGSEEHAATMRRMSGPAARPDIRASSLLYSMASDASRGGLEGQIRIDQCSIHVKQ